MIFNIAICDDEEIDINIISNYLSDFQMNNNVDFNISTFNNGKNLLDSYLKHGTYHILFLDVEMPGFSGLDIAKRVRKLPDRDVKIVFVSNYPEYMRDSFDVQAFHYLPKPLTYTNFAKIMKSIITDYNESHAVQCIIKTDLSEEVIYSNKIIYLKTVDAYTRRLLITLEDHSVETTGRLADWEKSLKWQNFIMPHRGYLINSAQIHYIEEGKLIMNDGSEIPMSRRKEKEVRNMFAKNTINLRRL